MASKALDWLFNNFGLKTETDSPLIMTFDSEMKLVVFRTDSGVEIIIGNSEN